MDHKAMQGNVITAVVVAAIMGIIAWAGGLLSAGNKALDEQQIKDVVAQVLIRDTGVTYAASLASIDGSLIAISTQVKFLTDEVDDLEVAVLALASE